MDNSQLEYSDTGLQVLDLSNDSAFAARPFHSRNAAMQMEAMCRLAAAFVERPETILQELVNAAVELCGADSAGISIERQDKTDEHFYHWIATAGVYSSFLDATLPRHPSACTICLERGEPQRFRVSKRFFDLIGVEASLVADGLLLPWQVEEMRGTIFVISHTRSEAFDAEDLRLMQVLSRFAAMGVRQQRQQERLLKQASAAAAAEMANHLAHQINNPLQAITNTLYLGLQAAEGGEDRSLASSLKDDFERLTILVRELLELPRRSQQSSAPLSELDRK